MWIIAVDLLGEFDVMFVPRMPYDAMVDLPDGVPEFGEGGWSVDDFSNPELYVAVYCYFPEWS